MAYYQAQDADGKLFEYSRPIVGYEEPSTRRRAIGGPVVLLLACAVFGLAVHSSLTSSATELVVAAVIDHHHGSNTNTSSLSAKPQGTRNQRREQGLEDIEDNDSADPHAPPPPPPSHLHRHHNDHHHHHHLPRAGPVIPSVPVSTIDEKAANAAISNDNENMDEDQFETCLQRSCGIAMKSIAQANPSGSALLNCLSASADGNAATTCWGPSNPDEEAHKDPEQTLRVCAICNSCIPGSVDQNLCNAPPSSWNDILGAPGGPVAPLTPTNADEADPSLAPHVIDAPPDTPIGKYEADKHHREHAPITNSSKDKHHAAKPWVPMMSGGRQNTTSNAALNGGNISMADGHHGVIPMLSFAEPTELARRSRHDDIDRRAPPPPPAAEPFWAKFIGGGAGGEAPWSKYMNMNGAEGQEQEGNNGNGNNNDYHNENSGSSKHRRASASSHNSAPASGGSPWDQYIPAGYTNFVDATDLAVSASSSPGSGYSKYQTKYGSAGDKYSGQGGSSGEPAATLTSGKSGPPTPMWEKYSSGGGGSHPGGAMAAYDAENLAVGSTTTPRAPAPAVAPLPPPPAQPVPAQPAWRYPSNPWEDRFNGQAPPPPLVTMQEDEEIDNEEELEATTLAVDTQSLPVSPWSKYSGQGGSSTSTSKKGGNSWDKYMSQGGSQSGGSSAPFSAYDVTELSASTSSKKSHKKDAEPEPKLKKRAESADYAPATTSKSHKRHPGPAEIEPVPTHKEADSPQRHEALKREIDSPRVDPEATASHRHATPLSRAESTRHAAPQAPPPAHHASADQPVYRTASGTPPASRPIGSGPNTPWFQGGAAAPYAATTPAAPTPSSNMWGPYAPAASRGVVATTVAVNADELEDELTTTSLSVSPRSHSKSSHHLSHKKDPLPPDSRHQHSGSGSASSAAVSAPPTKEEKTALNRCYQVGCNAQVGQAGAARSDALSCLSKANGKQEASDCLGPEDSKSPSDALRTCMICKKCIEGKLKNPSACAQENQSWNNRGSSWMP